MSNFGPRLSEVPRVYTHMPFPMRLVDWIQSRVQMLKDAIDADTRELQMWEQQLAAMPVCPGCNGHGRLREIISSDHSEYHKCKLCDGDGVKR